ncbi:APC family permease [Weissella paramesenteroides]|uniref:APC family permease n=1 Tax=Weissella sagaensis TaxID=2559928 RepID=UPI0005A6B457|nr:APC family permease [Weissella sagaensis]KAA8434438.1 APC family permease [Weissella paramesenteroides]QDJ59658.1 APC family permease [Weissella hellenica]KAA8437398.1 APC family permease [Weissella paramesenteroides]QEA56972.1 APC family permease [Weissella hellenica]UEG67786.1 APC family permease [Weissella hellenica]
MKSKKTKKIGLFQLVMLTLGSLIGSGWLFGSWEATRVAGPAAIISWVIGGLVIASIAYNYIELGTMFPEAGGMSRYAQYSHGPLLGFISSWSNWVSLIALIPIEAVAAVQYMSSWPWSWANWTNQFFSNGEITTSGLWLVFAFMFVFTLINFWSVTLLTRFTNFISIFKIGIPAITIIMLTLSSFHPGNYGHSIHEFMPYGSAPIFSATATAGIIFSFNAFQTVINMGSEIKDTKKNVKRGIFLSLLISGVIYVLIQSAFITAIDPATLAKYGWHGINFSSPFADLAILLGIHWLSVLLYLDAFVSPVGTGVSFAASTGRVLFAMESNKHIPSFLGKLSGKFHMPHAAMLTNLVISMLMVSVFRSWSTLATVVCASTLIAYLTGPVTTVAFRRLAPDFKRPIKLRFLSIMAPLAFVLASLAIYWSMWPTTVEVILVIMLGLPIYFYYEYKAEHNDTLKAFKSALWLIVYLIFISIISFIGSHEFNGINWIHYPWDFVVIIIISLIFYYWGVKSAKVFPDYYQAEKLNKTVKE